MSNKHQGRILIIEDDPLRISRLLEWLPKGCKAVIAESTGKALGLLNPQSISDYAGIVLDHDLQQQVYTEQDLSLSGSALINVIATRVPRWVPVLIQSVNVSKGPAMAKRLINAGFTVDHVPMSRLKQQYYCTWVSEALQLWQDMQDEQE